MDSHHHHHHNMVGALKSPLTPTVFKPKNICLPRNQFVKRALNTILPYTEEPFQCFWSPKTKLFKSNLVLIHRQILLPRLLFWDVSRKMAAAELHMHDLRNYEKVYW